MTCKKCGAKMDGRKNKCLCCGYRPSSKERKTWLWVLGWIFIFPLPLTLIILRNNDSKDKVKYAAVGLAWAAYLLMMIFGGSRENDPNRRLRDPGNTQVAVQPTVQSTETIIEARENEQAEMVRAIPNKDQGEAVPLTEEAEGSKLVNEKAELAIVKPLNKDEMESMEQAEKEAAIRESQEAAERAALEASRQAAEQAAIQASKEAAERAAAEASRIAAEQAAIEASRIAAEQAAAEASRQAAEQAAIQASKAAAEKAAAEKAAAEKAAQEKAAAAEKAAKAAQEKQKTGTTWVLNTNTKRIHYPSCYDVKKIKAENFATSDKSLQELMNMDYKPCGHCNPR